MSAKTKAARSKDRERGGQADVEAIAMSPTAKSQGRQINASVTSSKMYTRQQKITTMKTDAETHKHDMQGRSALGGGQQQHDGGAKRGETHARGLTVKAQMGYLADPVGESATCNNTTTTACVGREVVKGSPDVSIPKRLGSASLMRPPDQAR